MGEIMDAMFGKKKKIYVDRAINPNEPIIGMKNKKKINELFRKAKEEGEIIRLI